MGTKRFECIYDCWQHTGSAVVECLGCGNWIGYNMLSWPKSVPQNLPFGTVARRFRCSACGSKRIAVYPGNRPHMWKGNR
jgi:hypothetical protein